MRGADIPLITCYKSGKTLTTFKRPMYELKPAEEIKAHQKKLGKNASWYYGTSCRKCCGVFPAYMTENSFESLGYYVCLVCGKESKHEVMPWIARDSWNNGEYKWIPDGTYEQLTIFDFIGRDVL